MVLIQIQVHPLSKKVLERQYGDTSNIVLARHDMLFSMLCFSPVREKHSIKKSAFVSQVYFQVGRELALHVRPNLGAMGALLFKWHKELMCRDIAAAVRQGAAARPAAQEWLDLYGIDEDEYSLDAAYKCWQRFGWEMKEKNPQFSERFRGKTAQELFSFPGAEMPIKMTMRQGEIELRLSRFLEKVNSHLRMPRRFPGHARCYMHYTLSGGSMRRTAMALGVPLATVHYAVHAVKAWAEQNQAVSAFLAECCDLPQAQ